jgi:hypothetical protein
MKRRVGDRVSMGIGRRGENLIYILIGKLTHF